MYLQEMISGHRMSAGYIAKMPKSTRNIEQGDRKTLSSDSNHQIGKATQKKKKVSDVSNNMNISQGACDVRAKNKVKGKGSEREQKNYAEVYSR